MKNTHDHTHLNAYRRNDVWSSPQHARKAARRLMRAWAVQGTVNYGRNSVQAYCEKLNDPKSRHMMGIPWR